MNSESCRGLPHTYCHPSPDCHIESQQLAYECGQGTCPVCSGKLVFAGRESRCYRCGFALCEGCGGGTENF